MYESCTEEIPAKHVIRKKGESSYALREPGTNVRRQAFLFHRKHKRDGTQKKEKLQKRNVARVKGSWFIV